MNDSCPIYVRDSNGLAPMVVGTSRSNEMSDFYVHLDRDARNANNRKRKKKSNSVQNADDVEQWRDRHSLNYYLQPSSSSTTFENNLLATSITIDEGQRIPISYRKGGAPSLLSIAADYVARHLDRVDSLQGIPDHLGKHIFITASTFGQITPRQVSLFAQAYKEDFLSSLNLKFCEGIDKFLQHANETLYYVTSLDIGFCSPSHDCLLDNLKHMNGLVTLGLSSTEIDDDFVRRLCTPIKMFNCSPRNLVMLDLSRNSKLSDDAVKQLSCFTQLRSLNFSDTSITVKSIAWLMGKMSLECGCKHVCDIFPLVVEFEGWSEAKSAFDTWFTGPATSLSSIRSNFYGINKLPNNRSEITDVPFRRKLIFHKTEKRLCDPEQLPHPSQLGWEIKQDLDENELDLFSGYLEDLNTPIGKCRISSLW